MSTGPINNNVIPFPGAQARASAEAPPPDALPDGSPRAQIEWIYRVHGPRLMALALRLGGDQVAAEDLFHESMVKAFRALEGYQPQGRLFAWLARIVANCWTDELRRRGRLSVAKTVAVESSSQAHEEIMWRDTMPASPLHAAMDSQLRDALEKAIRMLPERQRSAVVLHDIEGLDGEEIGQVLGISPSSVRTHLSLGRKRLRQLLDPLLEGHGYAHLASGGQS